MNKWFTQLQIAALAFALSACQSDSDISFQGYVEADYRYLGSTGSGVLTDLNVVRGQEVKSGEVLFAIDSVQEQQELQRIDAQLQQQQALLENLQIGQRPQEIAVLRAQLAQAQAQAQQSNTTWQRSKNLREKNLVSNEQFDAAQLNKTRDDARVTELLARVKVAELGARSKEVDAAKANLKATQAQREQANWRLQQKQVSAPVTGVVQDVLFQPGEVVAATRPVIVLLPDEASKLRFFVPEKNLQKIQLNAQVKASCDGCGDDISATIRYISTQTEYTPPVLFNRDNRSELMFRVEAYPNSKNQLRVGQPLDIRLLP